MSAVTGKGTPEGGTGWRKVRRPVPLGTVGWWLALASFFTCGLTIYLAAVTCLLALLLRQQVRQAAAGSALCILVLLAFPHWIPTLPERTPGIIHRPVANSLLWRFQLAPLPAGAHHIRIRAMSMVLAAGLEMRFQASREGIERFWRSWETRSLHDPGHRSSRRLSLADDRHGNPYRIRNGRMLERWWAGDEGINLWVDEDTNTVYLRWHGN